MLTHNGARSVLPKLNSVHLHCTGTVLRIVQRQWFDLRRTVRTAGEHERSGRMRGVRNDCGANVCVRKHISETELRTGGEFRLADL